jgi:hypothetical protein
MEGWGNMFMTKGGIPSQPDGIGSMVSLEILLREHAVTTLREHTVTTIHDPDCYH